MRTVALSFSIVIDASQETVFEYVSDWEKQSDWVLFTTVKLVSGEANKKDPTLLAITKFGPIKVVDTMVVTDWQPPEQIVVEHTGRIVLGKGIFAVRKISDKSCEFTWQEITPVPFGFIGQIGLVFAKPIMNLLFGRSLKKLKKNIETTTSNS